MLGAADRSRDVVSVVIPCLNERDLIGRLIESIASQTYRPIEAIVVDGGSIDSTCNLVRELSMKLRSESFEIRAVSEAAFGTIRSPANARNIGVKMARGQFIVLLDSDFELTDPESIAVIKNALDSHLFTSVHTRFLIDTEVERQVAMIHESGHGCGYRKCVLEEVKFNPKLGYGEDKDFFYRARERFGFDPTFVCGTTIGRHLPHTRRELISQARWFGRTMPDFVLNAYENQQLLYLSEVCQLVPFMCLGVLPPFAFLVAIGDFLRGPLPRDAKRLFFLLWLYSVYRFVLMTSYVTSVAHSQNASFHLKFLATCLVSRITSILLGSNRSTKLYRRGGVWRMGMRRH